MGLLDKILVESNVELLLRSGGKLIDRREGHNVFTLTGANLMSKLVAWQIIGVTDVPYTNRRVRWMGVGVGSNLEVETVNQLASPALATSTDFLVTISSVEFPTTRSVRLIRVFGTNEITITPTPVIVTEAGLFADVNPAAGPPTEDIAVSGFNTTLSPLIGTNPPIAYKAFEPITKTQDFTLEIRWDFRF